MPLRTSSTPWIGVLLGCMGCASEERRPEVDLAAWMPPAVISEPEQAEDPESSAAENLEEKAPEEEDSVAVAPVDEPTAFESIRLPLQRRNSGLLLSLEDALQRAAAQALDIEIARSHAEAADAEESMASAAWLPTVSPGTRFIRTEGRVQDTGGKILEVEKQNTTYGGVIGLFLDPADALLGQRAARERATAAWEGVRVVAHDVLYTVAVRYFDLLEKLAQASIAERAISQAEELAAVEKARSETGAGLRVDYLRAKARVSQAVRDQLRVENEAAVRSAELAELLMLDLGTDLIPVETEIRMLTLVEEEELEHLVQTAQLARPELDHARSLRRAREEEEAYAEYGWLIPEVELSAGIGALGTTYEDAADRQDYVAGLHWDLGAWLFGAQDQAHARREAAEFHERRMRHRVATEVVQARRTVISTRAQVAAAHDEVAASTEAYGLARSRHEAGSGLLIEVLDAEVELTTAEMALAGAIADYNRSQFQLLRAIGGLKP